MDDTANVVYQLFTNLNSQQQAEILKKLNLSSPTSVPLPKPLDFQNLILSRNHGELEDRLNCPHCRSEHVVKNGHVRGAQRFVCKDCQKSFGLTNNTILFSTKKDIEVWQKYMECLADKLSLRKAAEKCEISVETAFYWRHKILDTLRGLLDSLTLSGTIEADETFFPQSYKGNHSKSGFTLPREAHERGGSNTTRGLSKEQVCVATAVDLGHNAIGKVSNLGNPSKEDLANALAGRMKPNSVMVTEKTAAYGNIAQVNQVEHVRIPSGKRAVGIYNVQACNLFHAYIKALTNIVFRGVSTKHLNNYVAYSGYVDFIKIAEMESYQEKLNYLQEYAFTAFSQTRCKLISKRDPLPVFN